MITEKIKLGRIGEEAAVQLLKQQGYRVIERNFRNRVGEIDIIATDGDTLCFIEVKTRHDGQFGSAFEAVTPVKQRKIARTALSYLKFKNKFDVQARFDVVAVMLDGDHCKNIEIIKNAFEAH